jgi:hypothetical protein
MGTEVLYFHPPPRPHPPSNPLGRVSGHCVDSILPESFIFSQSQGLSMDRPLKKGGGKDAKRWTTFLYTFQYVLLAKLVGCGRFVP